MKKPNLERERKELEAIFKRVDKRITRYGEMKEKELDHIIRSYRTRRASKGK